MAENPPAFPVKVRRNTSTDPLATPREIQFEGMSLRDWFAGQALANPIICTGSATEYEMRRWFGDRMGITRAEVVARQAGDYANAMLAAREQQSSRRFLQLVNWKTGERAEGSGKVEITGKSEREIVRIELGMVRTCDEGAGWFVDKFEEQQS